MLRGMRVVTGDASEFEGAVDVTFGLTGRLHIDVTSQTQIMLIPHQQAGLGGRMRLMADNARADGDRAVNKFGL